MSEEKNQRPKPRPKQKHLEKAASVVDDCFALLEEKYLFNSQQITFLQEFQKDCDIDAALDRSGYKQSTRKKFTDPDTPLGRAMLARMQEIQQDWLEYIKLNAQRSAKKHLELMEKFENDYDKADLQNGNKSGLASTLAKMSDSSLKATGQFANSQQNQGTKVEINIDLGSSEDKPIDIKAEEIIDG